MVKTRRTLPTLAIALMAIAAYVTFHNRPATYLVSAARTSTREKRPRLQQDESHIHGKQLQQNLVQQERHNTKKSRTFFDVGMLDESTHPEWNNILFGSNSVESVNNEDAAFWGRLLQASFVSSMPTPSPSLAQSSSDIPTSGGVTEIPTPSQSSSDVPTSMGETEIPTTVSSLMVPEPTSAPTVSLFPVPSAGPSSQPPVLPEQITNMPSGMQSGSDMPTTMQSNSDMPTMMQSSSDMPTTGESGTNMQNLVELIDAQDDLQVLAMAIDVAGLDAALSNDQAVFTTFGPLDDGFAALDQDYLTMLLTPEWNKHLINLLSYHVAAGEKFSTDLTDGAMISMGNGENITVVVTSNGMGITGEYFNTTSLIVEADLEATNGVLHKVDSVFIPAFFVNNLYDVLEGALVFKTLLSLVVTAGLDDAIRTGIMTVFAPVDAAFAALPADVVTYLTDPSNIDALSAVLLYHVVPDVIPSDMLVAGASFVTSNGNSIFVSTTMDNNILIASDVNSERQATVIGKDGLGHNGIAQALDLVLIPPDVMLPGENSTISTPAPTSADTNSTINTTALVLPLLGFSYSAPRADRNATDAEFAELATVTETFYTASMKRYYNGTAYSFDSLNATLRSGGYDLGIPDAKYNFYVVFAFMIYFDSASVPSVQDGLNAVSASDLLSYILDVRKIDGSPFAQVTDVFVGLA